MVEGVGIIVYIFNWRPIVFKKLINFLRAPISKSDSTRSLNSTNSLHEELLDQPMKGRANRSAPDCKRNSVITSNEEQID